MRLDISNLLISLIIVALLVVPVSLLGSPPLIFQWFENIANPDPNNISWRINNFSLHELGPFWLSIVILIIAAIYLRIFFKRYKKDWKKQHTIATLFLAAMFLSPYASQQSFSSPMAFVPSWKSNFIQYFSLTLIMLSLPFFMPVPIKILILGSCGLFFYRPNDLEVGIK
jgi:hypothetical protein